MERKKARWGWVFVIPSLILFSAFSFFPIMNAFYESFFNRNLLSLRPPRFVGWDNYTYLFRSKDFWLSVQNTLIFTLGTFLPLLVFSLILAVFIMSISRFRRFFQMAFYSPAVLSSVVAALIWLLIFDPRGLANQGMNALLGTAGINYNWLSTTGMLRLSTIIVYFWKYIGYFTVIFVSGIGSIPDTLGEAALIDGANRWTLFWHVTFPLLKPTTMLVSIMTMIQCLKTFSTQYMFTSAGAPTRPINVITLNIYNTAIKDYRIGRATAMSILLFVVMFVFTWLQLRVSRTEDVSYT
ncbi:MAG TPA: sugar ABC transporter permease [Firmicutes bacterium]|jgi:multiple sugar transport system permease protein|nr:sugar ABC transporter permease [Bacillota bacterium]